MLRWENKFLLANHVSRRRKGSTWGLPGGRLRASEKPVVGLRRELEEELRLRLPVVAELGDWWYREENYRVFGSEISRAVRWFDTDEIREIAWLTHAEIVDLAKRRRLQKGFELEAISEFLRRFST